jgi:hypothetical protein
VSDLDKLRWWDPVKLNKYPHLSVKDSEAANIYFETNILSFEKVCYDVIVGSGRDALPETPNNLLNDWEYLTSLKIDMIGKTLQSYSIIEFKGYGDLGAVGQLLGYHKLFIDKFAISNNINLFVICQFTHPDIIKAANALNVRFLLLSIDSPPKLY